MIFLKSISSYRHRVYFNTDDKIVRMSNILNFITVNEAVGDEPPFPAGVRGEEVIGRVNLGM